MTRTILTVALFASTVMTGATATAFAQASAPGRTGAAGVAAPGDGDGRDIVVTARRVEERLQDVPISITVFNQQQIASRNIVTAGDLATYTPSLSANSFFGGDATTFAIRGFVQDSGTQPSVGVYFADVVAPRGGGSQNVPSGDGAGPGSFFDLQNVQVLKGPQGTLFGRNTTGGAVLLVPQKPTDRLEGYVEGSYGSYNMRRIQAVVNLPLGDRARFRLGVDRQKRDGYLKNIGPLGPDRLDDIDYTAVRASLVADLTPDLENYTIASYSLSSRNGDLLKVVACDPTNFPVGLLACGQLAREAATGKAGFYATSTSFDDQHTRAQQWQIINTTTWKASDSLTVKNIASYAQFRQEAVLPTLGSQFDGSDLNPVLPLLGFPAGFKLPVGTYLDFVGQRPVDGHTADQETITEELQFQGNAGGRLDWQAGGYLEASNPLGLTGNKSGTFVHCSDYDAPLCTNPLGFGGFQQTIGKADYRSYGLYAQATYSLTDRLKATGGIRYTWDRTRSTAFRPTYTFPFSLTPVAPISVGCAAVGGLTAADAPVCEREYREQSQKPTWLVDLDYKPVRDMLLYAKYARGYRTGGLAVGVPTQFSTYKPEKVDTYEIGAKTSFDRFVRGTFDVSAFYNNFSDQQLIVSFYPTASAPTGQIPTSGVFNAGKSRIAGVEVESSIVPFEGFTLDASYSYLDTKIRRIVTPLLQPGDPFQIIGSQNAGDPLALTPKNKVSVTGTYTLPLDRRIGRVSVGATFTHVDRQISNYSFNAVSASFAGLSFLQPRNLLNLNASWNSVAGTPIDVSAFATNVTKQKYYVYSAGLIVLGYEAVQLGEPRMYGVRLRYRFGR